jgi:uncharacterized Zn finger protein (UPF0148 family)
MPLASCPRCGKIWNRMPGATVCSGCEEQEFLDRDRVRDCLNVNPGLNAELVSEKTGVDVKAILRMLEEGLIAREADLGKAVCGKCGAPAISHKKRLCERCLHKLNSQVMETRKHIEEELATREEEPPAVSTHQMLQKKRRHPSS